MIIKLQAVPNAMVVGKVGDATSFEVTVDNALIHSKLDTFQFPDHDYVIAVVKEAEEGKKPVGIIRSSQSPTCNVL